MKVRANNVGTTITGHLDIRSYILSKYDGLFPDGYPSKKEYIEVCRAIKNDPKNIEYRKTKQGYDKKIEAFQRDWQRLQTT